MTKTISLLSLAIVLIFSSCGKKYENYTCECKRGTGEVAGSRTSDGDMSKSDMQDVCDNDYDTFVNRNGWSDVTCKVTP